MGSNTNYKQIKIKINILDLYNSYEFVFMFTIDDTDTIHTQNILAATIAGVSMAGAGPCPGSAAGPRPRSC